MATLEVVVPNLEPLQARHVLATMSAVGGGKFRAWLASLASVSGAQKGGAQREALLVKLCLLRRETTAAPSQKTGQAEAQKEGRRKLIDLVERGHGRSQDRGPGLPLPLLRHVQAGPGSGHRRVPLL